MLPLCLITTLSQTDPPTSDYTISQMHGWTIYTQSSLKKDSPELLEKTHKILSDSLETITRDLPKDKVQILKKTKIWIDANSRGNSAAVYHPSREWLVNNKYNPDKTDSVEISQPKYFVDWANIQPSMVLHELAHAYHDQVLQFDNKEIKTAFEKAEKSKIYEAIKHINGQTQKHYALTNPQEFFAEMTEAYFGKNDLYPFVKSELKSYDPETYKLIENIWIK